jgi:hypothetical protein
MGPVGGEQQGRRDGLAVGEGRGDAVVILRDGGQGLVALGRDA